MSHLAFNTTRLLLTPTSTDDAPFLLELMNTAKWIQFIGDRNIKSKKDAEEFISNKVIPPMKRHGFSNYTISLKSTREKIGISGLYDRPWLCDFDLGFAMLPEFESQGYAYEAASRLVSAAFNTFGLNSLSAICQGDNEVSKHLLEKLGFKSFGPIVVPETQEKLQLYRLQSPNA